MKILIYISIFVAFIFSCNEPTREKYEYQSFVDYTYDTSRTNRPSDRLSKNRLYIFFEGYFEEDTIDIYVNKSDSAERRIISTEENVGIADVFEFKNIDAIHAISIRMNSGPTLIIKTKDIRKNIWWVGYWSDTLRAQPLKNPLTYE